MALTGCGMFGSEPAEEEPATAVRNHFEAIAGDGTISNLLNNVHLILKSVRKIGCEPANEGPGYFCTYETRMGTGASSNEANQEGQDHAAAVNALFYAMSGGQNGIPDQNTHRFVSSWGDWELVQE
ncbi:MAG: hypothetical protein EOP50_22235 [Sphingobacteriales bacterium]|nr:MAG: hypothetical protein EOP50_22235 [Sphingobacteriales bacterium]